MISNRIFTFTLCGIIFVFINIGAKAAPPYEEMADVENLPVEPNFQPYLYVGEEEPVELIDFTDRKFKRQTPIGKKQSIEEILPKIPSGRVKELLKMLNKPKKSEILTLNGWSASGMPFNVLYTPNILQQKMLLSNPERKPVQVPTSEPPSRGNYINGKKDNGKETIRTGTKPPTKASQMRKHYLVIPQLFVSYGWGPVGK